MDPKKGNKIAGSVLGGCAVIAVVLIWGIASAVNQSYKNPADKQNTERPTVTQTQTVTPTPEPTKTETATPEPIKTKEKTVMPRTPVVYTPALNTPEPTAQGQCDPNYSGVCVPIASDVDCAGGSGNGPAYVRGPVTVIGRDIYDLDRDGNGIGCE